MRDEALRSPRRRAALRAAGALTAALWLPGVARAASPDLVEYRLRAAPAKAALAGPPHPDTAVWSYNGTVPGPTLRARQGDRLRIVVENALAEETTVHWHGLRVPNAMDGVPGLTQAPIPPGGEFLYAFPLRLPGTYW